MTCPHKFEAKYRNLPTAVGLDYYRMMRGKMLVELPLVLANVSDYFALAIQAT